MATLKILFTDRALREMREILGFIAQDNPGAASDLAEQIMKSLDNKARFPKSGRRIPEAPDHPARELILPPCRIFYSMNEKALHVLGLIRSEQQFLLSRLGH
ncbi:type II toxin-antitoxin system RelE/ParE family toxin [Mesoterricola silvestris]|uniref:type II toxin-antitoxin system RelE/ParE family toxin n=1 Tax=Mesoterricola silvestris TaxID=2927979 RepID=UPI00292E8D55|nr:type II toxin-antitoxin system RelE/ParE family toxin [Mesoterricola silvestris]